MKASVIDGRKCERIFVVVDGIDFHIGCKDARRRDRDDQ
jgi:hypothetical protein